MFAIINEISREPGDSADPCPSLCNYTEFLYLATHFTDPALNPTSFHIQMHYPTLEYEVVEEVYQQSFSDCVSLIGGTFGLWLGASLITLVHLLALFANAGWNLYMKKRLINTVHPPPTPLTVDENERIVALTRAIAIRSRSISVEF